MQRFEKVTLTLPLGLQESLQALADKYPDLYDNKSHAARCGLIQFLRHERQKGRFTSEVVK